MSGGAALATAFVEVKPDLKGFGPALKDDVGKAVKGSEADVDRHGKRLGGRLAGGMRGALGGLGGSLMAGIGGGLIAGGISEIAGSLGGFINGARDAEKIGRLTNQVIKSTGGVAGVTADHVSDLATAISNKTGIDDDAIAASQNLLLTFTDVRNEVGKGNDVFDQATSLVTDMSVALGQSGKAGAIQLGKALNDPIKGVSALSKVGVSFTEQQKKQIKTLTESGDKLGAQKIILGELSKEFGGAAAAGADPMQKLGTVLTNVGEGLAGKLLPMLDKGANWLLNTGLPAFETFTGWLGANVVPVLGNIANFIGTTVIPGIQTLATAFMENVWPAIQTVAAIIAENLQPVIASLMDYWTSTLLPGFRDLWPILQTVGKWIGVVVGVIAVLVSWIVGKLAPILLNIIGGAIRLFIAALGKVVGAVQWVIDIVTDVWPKVKGIFDKVVGFMKKVPGWIGSAFSGLVEVITWPFRTAFNLIADLWNNTVGGLEVHTPDIPGTDFGGINITMPKIPKLAEGGIVPATRGGRIVRVAEGGKDEIVGPLDKVAAIFGGRSVVVQVDARGAAAGEGAAFREAAERIAREVVYGIAREVSY